MKKMIALVSVCFVLLSSLLLTGCGQEKEKFAIILQADTDRHEGIARAFHALLYAKELKKSGHDVLLLFDGAGTHWIEELTRPEGKSPLIPAYLELAKTGVVQVICDFCSNSFGVKEQLEERDLPLEGGYEGHPSIAALVKDGYELIIL